MSPSNHRFGSIDRREGTFLVCTTLFSVVLVLTNIIGVKLFVLCPGGGLSWLGLEDGLTLTSGILTYPITFLLTDLVAEIWGKKRANFMVVLGFFMSAVMLGFVLLARSLEPSAFFTNDAYGFADPADMERAWDASFSNPPVLLAASMTAYLVAQLFDVRLYHFWWRITQGRHMWIRNNGSTSISQLVDTIIVNGVFLKFGLGMELPDIAVIIRNVYLVKLVLAAIDTPFIYLGRSVLRSWFGLAQEDAPLSAPLAGEGYG